jgi:bifunctional non-homologous end joining protein LigD
MGTTSKARTGRTNIASLDAYRKKRNFAATSEPRGHARGTSRLYIVQKHAASRLHFDFRLELDGTLKSWAVPKGPSIKPGSKRLAVHVEDHPVEYGSFEGVIPEGEYGGGTVMLWDRGTWEPIGDAKAGYRAGKLKFRLRGKRLKGLWSLVRMSGAAADGGKNWLLIKDRDDAAGTVEPIDRDKVSVVSGRSMDAIRRDRKRIWRSDGGEDLTADPAELPGARRGRVSAEFKPQLATFSKEVPRGDEWLHEVKLDGYRILAFMAGKRVRLMSRNGKDWTARFPEIAKALAKLPVGHGVLDGEVVALRSDGVSDFQMLQNVLKSKDRSSLAYYVFDIPFYAGHDLRAVPLIERKALLSSLLARVGTGPVRFNDHVRGRGPDVLAQARKLDLEGIVSKRADAAYQSKRAPSWLKVKVSNRQELIIVGWTEPQGSRRGFGSLLLGHHDDAGRLVYSGKVGTGFDQALLRALSARLKQLHVAKPPLAVAPPAAEVRGAHWVRPTLVAEIEFLEWTADGRLRHPAFLGLREDKEPSEVVRESRTSRTAPSPSRSSVRLTHPDRVLWPEEKLTKQGLADYYEQVAELALPHLVDRPLAIVRCPNGRTKPCFFQKHASRGKREHLSLHDLDGLMALVQMGALEIHPWGAREKRTDRPDRLIFDLDPGPGVPWRNVVATALALRERLGADRITSFVRTSGGKGLHVVAPLTPRATWSELRTFSRGIAEEFVRRNPGNFVATAAKSARTKRIFIDWHRNGEGATAVAPYSTRARPGAPVAAPLAWSELAKVRSGDAIRVRDMKRRLAKAGDPWAGFFDLHQTLPASARRARAR